MRRLTTFVMGMITGGLLLYGAMHFHVIRAHDGFHFVSKMSPTIAATYVDIRGFSVSDWAQHSDIAAALLNANQGELMKNAASGALHDGLDRLLQGNEQAFPE